ncbi:MAG: hypothetical protein KatS3mg109_0286 [Pirellulaceae bacterium]|nr:MAG: hypothetical protein KatS3mg109_0286 [Pirellulaceae bacterium]
MATIACFESALNPEAKSHQGKWRMCHDPPYLKQVRHTLVISVPGDTRVSVNGLPVIGRLQVVRPGDLVRSFGSDGCEVSYVVGSVLPRYEPGQGRQCQLTGLPVEDQGVRCACGRLYCQGVANQLEHCPVCQASLLGNIPEPPEELL